jgi:hypothetical protein
MEIRKVLLDGAPDFNVQFRGESGGQSGSEEKRKCGIG